MEELKLLVTMVADLPSMALWVIAFFFGYKTIIIGSIYGVIRLGIVKLHDVLIQQRTKGVNLKDSLTGMVILNEMVKDDLIWQINRVRGKGLNIESKYIHERSVDWLREAINDKEDKERAKGGE